MNRSIRHPFCILLLIVGGLIVAAGCGTGSDQSGAAAQLEAIYQSYPILKDKEAESATVRNVIDGDTFETASGERVRLIGIDTPEVYGAAEHYGKEASAFSKAHLTGKSIWMFRDVSETDRYGRLLRYVFLQGETTMFNERLAAEGYAHPAAFPPDVLFAEQFALAGRKAREERKGLWSEPSAENMRLPSCDNPQIKGNINSRGDRIYHLPGSRYYEQTIAENMFCTEEEAVQAGFRAPKGN